MYLNDLNTSEVHLIMAEYVNNSRELSLNCTFFPHFFFFMIVGKSFLLFAGHLTLSDSFPSVEVK